MARATIPRIAAAVLTIVGIALGVAGLSIGSIAVAVAGLTVAMFGLGLLIGPRTGIAYPDQEPFIRDLWQAARNLPDNRTFVDLPLRHRTVRWFPRPCYGRT